jgi:hypothetical protein
VAASGGSAAIALRIFSNVQDMPAINDSTLDAFAIFGNVFRIVISAI